MGMHKSSLLVLFAVFCLASLSLAGEPPSDEAARAHSPGEAHHGKTADEVAKELANPNNSFAKLQFKNQFRWYSGDLPDANDQFNYTLLFQPVFPFSLGTSESGAKRVFFARPAIPLLIEQPVPTTSGGQFSFEGITALGDIGFDLAYGQTEKSGFLWALGMAGTVPTATDSAVGGKQLRLGPEFLLASISPVGLIGVFPNHQWNVTGWSNQQYSTTSTQFFLTATPGGGWAIGTQPTISYDWVNRQWTVPLHLTVSKTVILGTMPLKLELELNYYVVRPDAFAPKWLVSFNVSPIVANVIERLIKGVF